MLAVTQNSLNPDEDLQAEIGLVIPIVFGLPPGLMFYRMTVEWMQAIPYPDEIKGEYDLHHENGTIKV
jgi:hypothetical protein